MIRPQQIPDSCSNHFVTPFAFLCIEERFSASSSVAKMKMNEDAQVPANKLFCGVFPTIFDNARDK